MTAFLSIAFLLMQEALPPVERGSLIIQGTVTDFTRALMPGVSVSVKSERSKLPRLAVTDETGRYSVHGLSPGKYEILAELPGFTRDPRTVDLDASITIDFVMLVPQVNTFGPFGGGVTASAEPVLPQVDRATITRRSAAMRLAAQLWQFSMQTEGLGEPRGMDSRRSQILNEFHALGADAVPALSLALQDRDARMRRNAALVLLDLSGGFSTQQRERVDIREALPALIAALGDSDSPVRAWSAQALGQIGPAAKDALPTLRNALNDPNADVRRFVQNAINSIDMN